MPYPSLESNRDRSAAIPDALLALAQVLDSWTSEVSVRATVLAAWSEGAGARSVLATVGAHIASLAAAHHDVALRIREIAASFVLAGTRGSSSLVSTRTASILETARSQLGYNERRRGKLTNITKYGAWFGTNGQPWCATFVSWVFDQAGTPLPTVQRVKGEPGFAQVRSGYVYAKQHRQLVWTPRVGDVFLRKTSGVKGHTGIVVDVDEATGMMTTIEGNTNRAGSREGTTVMRKQRRISYANMGFWRPSATEPLSQANRPSWIMPTWPEPKKQRKARRRR